MKLEDVIAVLEKIEGDDGKHKWDFNYATITLFSDGSGRIDYVNTIIDFNNLNELTKKLEAYNDKR